MKFNFQRKYFCIPYCIFLAIFIIVPIILIFIYAFINKNGTFSFKYCFDFFFNKNKIPILLNSLFIALQTSIICLLLGYPIAFFLAKKKDNGKFFILLFAIPLWINFILRIGVLRDLLSWLNIGGDEKPYLATIIGMVYNFLPFAILPLYATMLKIDNKQIEAASDLGAKKYQIFIYNIIPQTLGGIISALIMIFIPVLSSYVISDIFSEGKIILFGNVIHILFANAQWNLGSFLSLIMLLIVFSLLFITKKISKKNVVLWQ